MKLKSLGKLADEFRHQLKVSDLAWKISTNFADNNGHHMDFMRTIHEQGPNNVNYYNIYYYSDQPIEVLSKIPYEGDAKDVFDWWLRENFEDFKNEVLAAHLPENSRSIASWFSRTWTSVENGFKSAIKAVGDLFKKIAAGIAKAVKFLFELIIDRPIFSWISGALADYDYGYNYDTHNPRDFAMQLSGSPVRLPRNSDIKIRLSPNLSNDTRAAAFEAIQAVNAQMQPYKISLQAEMYYRTPGTRLIDWLMPDSILTPGYTIDYLESTQGVNWFASLGINYQRPNVEAIALSSINRLNKITKSHIRLKKSLIEGQKPYSHTEKVKLIVHELGHTLGLKDINRGSLVTNSVMDYSDKTDYTQYTPKDLLNLGWMYA